MDFDLKKGDFRVVAIHLEAKYFDAFYAEHKRNVYGYLVSGLKDQDEAGDVLQDVFLKMFEKIKTGTIRSDTARAYLFSITRNAMFDCMKRRSKVSLLEEPDNISYDEITDETSRIRVLFMDALIDLPKDIAKLLEMRLINKMTIDEICKISNTPRASLYRKMEKGLHQVAEFFRKEGFDLGALEL